MNEILNELKEELSVTNQVIHSLHKTNEEIIGCIVKHSMGKEKTQELYEKHKNIPGNILHGDGWMIEYLAAKEHWDRGKAAFIAFGKFLDPAGFDLIVIPNKLDEKINFNVDYSSFNGAE